MDNQTSLIGLDFEGLKAALAKAGVEAKAAPMRARQLWNWIYVHGARDFTAMTNLAKSFRAEMAEGFTLGRPEVVTEQISTDGTRKWLLKSGGQEFETVYHPGSRSRHAVRLLTGGLHAQLPLLPHGHPEARAQPDAGRDRRPAHDRARQPRRLAEHRQKIVASRTS